MRRKEVANGMKREVYDRDKNMMECGRDRRIDKTKRRG